MAGLYRPICVPSYYFDYMKKTNSIKENSHETSSKQRCVPDKLRDTSRVNQAI